MFSIIRYCCVLFVILIGTSLASNEPLLDNQLRHRVVPNAGDLVIEIQNEPEEDKYRPRPFKVRLFNWFARKPALAVPRNKFLSGAPHHLGFANDIWRNALMPKMNDPKVIGIMKQLCKASYIEFSQYPLYPKPKGYGTDEWRKKVVGLNFKMTPAELLKRLQTLAFFAENNHAYCITPGLDLLDDYSLCPSLRSGWLKLREKFPTKKIQMDKDKKLSLAMHGGDQVVSYSLFLMKTSLYVYFAVVNFKNLDAVLQHPEFPSTCHNIYGFVPGVFPLLYGAVPTSRHIANLARNFFVIFPPIAGFVLDLRTLAQESGARICDQNKLLNFRQRFAFWKEGVGFGKFADTQTSMAMVLYGVVFGWIWNPVIQSDAIWKTTAGAVDSITPAAYAMDVVNATGVVLKDKCCTVLGNMVQAGCQALPDTFTADQMIHVWNMSQPHTYVYEALHAAAPVFILTTILAFQMMMAFM